MEPLLKSIPSKEKQEGVEKPRKRKGRREKLELDREREE